MKELRDRVYTAIASLLDYPRADFRQRLADCRELLAGKMEQSRSSPAGRSTPHAHQDCRRFPAQASAHLADFDVATRGSQPDELEELYTRTFDFNPSCALEIGWHLFGEDYHRGALLVRLRDELRRHSIQESCELPDHLIHVLPLVDCMNSRKAAEFSRACVIPAVEKMVANLEGKQNPYESLLRCLAMMLHGEFGSEACTADVSPDQEKA